MSIIRAFLIALALAALSVAVRAQQPSAPSAAAQFSGKLAELLTDTIAERDTARAQVAACQAAAKAAPAQTPPSETPK